MTVPGVNDAAGGGPPGGGVLPAVTSSALRIESGRQGNAIAESINRRERLEAKHSTGSPRAPARKRGDLPDGDYTLEDLERLADDEDKGWDPKGLRESVVIVDEHAADDGARLASRILSRMGGRGR